MILNCIGLNTEAPNLLSKYRNSKYASIEEKVVYVNLPPSNHEIRIPGQWFEDGDLSP